MNDSKLPVQYFNRYTHQNEEEVIYGELFLRFIYHSRLGKLALMCLVKRAVFSKWYGWRMNQKRSRKKIRPFVKKYQINMADCAKPLESYESFNAFFARELRPGARPIDSKSDTVILPADGRHLGFQDVSKLNGIFVKGQHFHLEKLLQSQALGTHYARGTLVLSRLCPVDYHRFHFPANGQVSEVKTIQGNLNSVNPLALRQNIGILWENKRTLTMLKTDHFGQVLLLEIGATCVGSIQQTYQPHSFVQKGQEKGYFLFGGSSTILLFEEGCIQLADDLLTCTANNIELYARMGDVLGHKR